MHGDEIEKRFLEVAPGAECVVLAFTVVDPETGKKQNGFATSGDPEKILGLLRVATIRMEAKWRLQAEHAAAIESAQARDREADADDS